MERQKIEIKNVINSALDCNGNGLDSACVENMLSTAQNERHLNPAHDYVNGEIWFGVKVGEKLLILNSRRKFFPLDAVAGYTLTSKGFTKSKFSIEGIKRFKEGTNVDGPKLFSEIKDVFSNYVLFKHPSTPTVLTLWVMASYGHRVFGYFPYLWFNSPTKRSGKSKALELISAMAFNATNLSVNPSAAYMYRQVAANSSTLVIDELEELRGKDKDEYGHIVRLLNAGFKRGGTVPRIEGTNNNLKPVDFEAYSAKAFAGISSLPDTLEDRSLKIVMMRKKTSEKIERFDDRVMAKKMQHLRDDLYIWALENGEIIDSYYSSPELLGLPEQLDDRAKDIFEPLYAVAKAIDNERPEANTLTDLTAFALDQAGIRQSAEIEDSSIVQVVAALCEVDLGPAGRKVLPPQEIWELLRDRDGLEWLKPEKGGTKTRAGRLIGRLDIHSKIHRIEGEPGRGYLLTADIIEDLRSRYMPSESVTSVTTDEKGA